MNGRKSIVIFGATGDLARTMLFPSLYFLDADGCLPGGLAVIGSGRSEFDDAGFARRIRETVADRAGEFFREDVWARFAERIRYCGGDAREQAVYGEIAAQLRHHDEIIFYLATSPDFFGTIAQHLKSAGLAHGGARVCVEKPLGHDLKSCLQIENDLAKAFTEDRIFRVDHYLGKETVQNLLALRFANTLFEPLWNKDSIEHVQITVAETIGVEGRWSYYDHYGALRDIVQNHLLQLLCLVAMEPPANLEPDSVRNEKVKVVRSLRPITANEVERDTVRGQYAKGFSQAGPVPGYTGEKDGGPSETETFVALTAHVDNWRWAGVPFYLRTGKRMAARSTQIVVQFREVPHYIFSRRDLMANRLTIRLQPEEEISLSLMNKTPSLDQDGMQLKPLSLNLNLIDAYKRSRRRIAYERLLLDVLRGNQTLFVRRDETENAWRWIDTIEEGWRARDMKPEPYAAGSWGPADAYTLIGRDGQSWCD
ncbi:MAG TPA: glucose-6-phosphate dehydrogenase [Rhizomicrobium sp.]|jgi:glucose-6-phosphate 1-dehydrogenase|nr:glucose-6-phosphate dehydrogenase [Rhizomicrobium sp.]HWA02918.1 glucose-6-phosphate dehydrogenase [Rhizomicrobium sp.]